jgi:hypothetical protein
MRPGSMSTNNTALFRLSSYSEIAAEYYDPVAHPTCANFRTASRFLLLDLGIFDATAEGHILELGAGRSLVAEMLLERGNSLNRLVISDKFEEMLHHSECYARLGAKLQLLDACSLEETHNRFDLVIGVLADPYNTADFWYNLGRLTLKNGLVALTFPSFDWMRKYRILKEGSNESHSVFQTKSGDWLNLPSFIWPSPKIVEFASSVGLRLLKRRLFSLAQLGTSNISSKLLVPGNRLLSIAEGYLFRNEG